MFKKRSRSDVTDDDVDDNNKYRRTRLPDFLNDTTDDTGIQSLQMADGVYRGEWGMYRGVYGRNGQGKMTYTNKDVFDGQWQNDMRLEGTQTYANGDVYKGAWENDMRNGQGTLTNKDGVVLHQGIWTNDVPPSDHVLPRNIEDEEMRSFLDGISFDNDNSSVTTNETKDTATTDNTTNTSSSQDVSLDAYTKSQLVKLLQSQQVCYNSGLCNVLGPFAEHIRTLFDDMDFRYVTECKRIGQASVNGDVFALKYQFAEAQEPPFVAHCVMKQSKKASADNLMIEWYIGHHFINHKMKQYPCFVETYGLYRKAQRGSQLENLQDLKTVTRVPNDQVWNLPICTEDNTTFAVLCQHLENCESLYTFLEKNKHEKRIHDDIYNILVQIYLPLGDMMDVFTHNDLHDSNVMLYFLPNKQSITLHYHDHLHNKTITIQTRFLVKIIDYGRCFFTSSVESTPSFFQRVLQTPSTSCNAGNLHMTGLRWNDAELTTHNHFTSQMRNNPKRDLWCASIVAVGLQNCIFKQFISGKPVEPSLRKLHGFLRGIPRTPEKTLPTQMCATDLPYCNVREFAYGLVALYSELYTLPPKSTSLVGELSVFVFCSPAECKESVFNSLYIRTLRNASFASLREPVTLQSGTIKRYRMPHATPRKGGRTTYRHCRTWTRNHNRSRHRHRRAQTRTRTRNHNRKHRHRRAQTRTRKL